MCELLIQAKPHWTESATQEQLDKCNPQSVNARIQLGDIVVVKPNGWEWGREECLPNYYILKVPNISVEEAEFAVQSLMDTSGDEPVMLKKRKYQIPPQIINQLNNNDGVLTTQVDSTWLSNLIEKTS